MKNPVLMFGSFVAIAIVLVLILKIQFYQSVRTYHPSPVQTSPVILSDEEMELTDVGAELETLDADFDADLQKLDAELKGL